MPKNIDREQDEHNRRWYMLPDGERYMSVTTILKYLDEDMTGLMYWQKKHNGRGDAADHRHLLWYMQRRGTMCHYHALKRFENVFTSDDGMYGSGEAEAMSDITAENKNAYIIYSLLKYKGVVDTWHEFLDEHLGETTLLEILQDDVDYFVSAFDDVCDELDITSDSVIGVEHYLFESDVGYGGQCDLLYEDSEGNVVLADLKTSGGIRQKHIIQSAAYSKAVEKADDVDVDTVDRQEVIRIHPDSEVWQVHAPEEVTENHTSQYWFKDKYGNWEYESQEEQWEMFKETVDRAYENKGDKATEWKKFTTLQTPEEQ